MQLRGPTENGRRASGLWIWEGGMEGSQREGSKISGKEKLRGEW